MAKVAAPGTLSSNSLHYGGGALKMGKTAKRKTPSELRGEQLKKRNAERVDESPAPLLGSVKNPSGEINGLKKPDLKNPRYIDTRMDDVFPVRKPSCRVRMLLGKENTKENISKGQNESLKNQFFPSDLAAKTENKLLCSEVSIAPSAVSKDGTMQAEASQTAEKFSENASHHIAEDKTLKGQVASETTEFSCMPEGSSENSAASVTVSKDVTKQTYQTVEKSSQNTFRGVAELSLGHDRSSGFETADMDKALKGLVACEPRASSCCPVDSSETFGDLTVTHSGNFSYEFHIPGQKIPLDFTLKTTMRVLSSSSVNWFHRLITCSAHNDAVPFTSQSSFFSHQNNGGYSGPASTAQVFNANSLHSWIYPQSSLPPSFISALNLSAAEGVGIEFLSSRQSAWEESFRSLYYMLRKNACGIFYVCTPQFVVMFTAANNLGKTKCLCNAFVSRSTRGLRSLLREHDIGYSMPLCRTKIEQVNMEDLVELSEIEKHNLGQARRVDSMHDVDNSPESLLAFSGNKNVHGLYDFLLNYRSFLTSLNGGDVPVLFAPVPFQNAALSAPEVRCKEMKKADHIAFPLKGSEVKDSGDNLGSSIGLCYSVEIKGAYLPPWIICNMCAAMGSEGSNFEASFITEPTSTGLNVALETVCQKSDSQAKKAVASQESSHAFGIQNAVSSPSLHSALLKGLKYSSGSYLAFLTHI